MKIESHISAVIFCLIWDIFIVSGIVWLIVYHGWSMGTLAVIAILCKIPDVDGFWNAPCEKCRKRKNDVNEEIKDES